MGRDAVVTYEQIAAAADGMKAAGGKPTARSIRERLGHVGSMGTIHRMLQTWRAGQAPAMGGTRPLPAALQRAILAFMDEELARAKAILDAELAEQGREAADLAAENERLALALEDRNEAVTALQAERATLEGRLAQMDIDLAAAKADARQAGDAAETARIEAAVLTARLEAATARTAKAEAEAADATRQARLCREALAKETAKGTAAQNSIAKLNGKLDAMQAHLKQQSSDLTAARQVAKKAGEEAAELRGKRAKGK